MGLIFLDMTVFHVKDQIGNKLTDQSLVHHIQQVSFVPIIFVSCLDSLHMKYGAAVRFRERNILRHHTPFVKNLSLSVSSVCTNKSTQFVISFSYDNLLIKSKRI